MDLSTDAPGAVELAARRDDTTPGKLGIWLFLASEVMLFGALVVAYLVLRASAVDWPRPSQFLSLPLGAANCLVLVASSITFVLAWSRLQQQAIDDFRAYLAWTNRLAVLFLAVKGLEYWQKLSQHILDSDRTFLALYFTITGVHALHVVGGLGVQLYLASRASRQWIRARRRFVHRVEIAGIYWHFVDLVWLLLFLVLYVV